MFIEHFNSLLARDFRSHRTVELEDILNASKNVPFRAAFISEPLDILNLSQEAAVGEVQESEEVVLRGQYRVTRRRFRTFLIESMEQFARLDIQNICDREYDEDPSQTDVLLFVRNFSMATRNTWRRRSKNDLSS